MATSNRRRAYGEGLIHKRGDGRWEARFDTGAIGGRRQRQSVYGESKAEVAAKLREAQRRLDRGLPLLDERTTVGQFLARWLTEVVEPSRSRNTFNGYSVNVHRHLVPLVGSRRLVKLTPADVQAVLNIKQAEGLAPRTVQYIHATLRAALGVAMRWGLVERNVATLTEPIRLIRTPVIPFSLDEVKRLLKASAEDQLAAFWTVAVAIGLRPSEALALRWSDVDLDARRVFVRNTLEWRTGSWSLKQPKSRTSRRIISLPKVCAEALRAHRVRQSEARLAAEEWDDQDFVFTTDTGVPLSRWQINYRFDRLQERAGVRHHRLYDCRHTAASLLLAQGVAPRVVMEILGHSSYSLTMDTYTHVLPTLLSDAADAMDRTLAEF